MGRKSLTGEKESKYAKFRVDTEVQDILTELKAQKVNRSVFIRDKIKSIDTSILKALIPAFIEKELFIESITPEMVERIKELYSEVSS